MTSTYDSNLLRDPADRALATYGVETRLGGSYRSDPKRPGVMLDATIGLHRFADTEERDYESLRLRAGYRHYLSDRWNAELFSLLSRGVLTAEYEMADQYNVATRVEYDPGYHHRARLYLAYRHRAYRDEGSTSAHSPYALATYRYRFGSWHYLDSEVWYEVNRAELDRRTFNRIQLRSEYTRPLGDDDRLRVGLEYQTQPYGHQRVDPTGDLRHDQRAIADLIWIHDLWKQTRLYTGYQYRTRFTNAPDRDYTSHQVSVTLRYDW